MSNNETKIDDAGTLSEQCQVIPFLSSSALERLALLSEELGEAQQAIGKILRHGYKSYHPLAKSPTNQEQLEFEIGDIYVAIQMMLDEGDIRARYISDRMEAKTISIRKYLHHQGV